MWYVWILLRDHSKSWQSLEAFRNWLKRLYQLYTIFWNFNVIEHYWNVCITLANSKLDFLENMAMFSVLSCLFFRILFLPSWFWRKPVRKDSARRLLSSPGLCQVWSRRHKWYFYNLNSLWGSRNILHWPWLCHSPSWTVCSHHWCWSVGQPSVLCCYSL